MLFLVYRIFIFIALVFSPVFACAQPFPPTTFPTASPPETCEEDVWDIIKARADEEANREITQNQNLISKPDSVLMMTCFDRQMAHLGNYAQDHFPSGPDESLSNGVSIGGIWTNLLVILIRETLGDIDPYLTGGRIPPSSFTGNVKGGQLRHLLEILVLDNLVSGVSSIANTYDDLILGRPLLCVDGKQFYIDDNNFDGVMLGGRANSVTGNIQMLDDLPETNFNGCPMMNEIWNQARCMSFQMDTNGAVRDNDKFHPLQRIDALDTKVSYVAREAADQDFRIYPSMCQRGTKSNGDLAVDLACHLWSHGIPPLPSDKDGNTFASWADLVLNLYTSFDNPPWTLLTSLPTYWADLATNSAVIAGGPGGTDVYLHQRDMFRSATAAECTAVQPVRNGLIVRDKAGNDYYDAICPAAGCYFIPPTTLAATGSCNR